jgi:hypothetical protein
MGMLAWALFGQLSAGVVLGTEGHRSDGASSLAGQSSVELEVVVEAAAGSTRQHDWAQLLGNAGIDRVSFRPARRGDAIGVSQSGSGDTRVIKVVAALDRRNQLVVPGAKFGIDDAAKIRDYFERLRDDGPDVALAEKKAFGLTAEQLVELHTRLAATHHGSTKGVAASEILAEIIDASEMPIRMNATARRAVASDFVFPDELDGLAVGTVLAAALRPLGLVLVPRRPQGGDVEIEIVAAHEASEHWPIGWPPDQSPGDIAPQLFTRLGEVEIRNYALGDAVAAVAQRIGMPILYDHNALAAEGIDLSAIKVTLVGEQLSHNSAIRALLAEAKKQMKKRLTVELRCDEAGQPFLWIFVR